MKAREAILISFCVLGNVASLRAADGILSVCEVLSDPLRYQDKMVSIRARRSGGSEGAWLIDPDCKKPLVTKGYQWPTAIWVTSPGQSVRFDVDFVFDRDSGKQVERQIKKMRIDRNDPRLYITYIGLFQTAPNLDFVIGYDDKGKLFGDGFGHLNSAPAQLLVKEMRDPRLEK